MKRTLIFILVLGCFSSALFSQRNPMGMKFNAEVDSLFYVFNPESTSIDTKFHEKFSIEYLLKKLKDNDEHLQFKALFLLGYKDNPETIKDISKFLSHNNERLVKHAIHTLEKIDHSQSVIVLGESLIENDYLDKHIPAYIIHSITNLTYIEGKQALLKYVSKIKETAPDYHFENLALEGINLISRYNSGQEEKKELLKELLKKREKRKWVLKKILLEDNKTLWLSELRLIENDTEVLIVRQKLGDTTLTKEEKSFLNSLKKRKTCQ